MTRIRGVGCLLTFTSLGLAVLLMTHVAAAQNPAGATTNPQATPAPNGAISGTVFDGSTGAPLADVIVSLSVVQGGPLTPGHQARQMTDAKGRFAFVNLPNDGRFQIAAGKFGYLDGGYGRDSSPTDPLRLIAIANGSWVGNLRVNIWTSAKIAGMVRDESGEPVVGVIVRAIARIRVAGRNELAAGPLTVTDDFGRYRLSGLLPGRYIIQIPSPQMAVPAGTRINTASTNVPEGAMDVDDTTRLIIGRFPLPPPRTNGRVMAYGPAFHPNAGGPAQATTVDVHFGDDLQGIDVALTPVPAVRVSGVVEGPPEALAGLTLRLLPIGMENLGLGAEAATALVTSSGSFTFVNVPAGSYTLDAPVTFNEFSIASGATSTGGSVGSRGASLPSLPGGPGWSRSSQSLADVPGVNFSSSDFRGASGAKVPNYSARMPLTVGGSDIAGLVVRLRPALTLRGRVIFDSDPSKPAATAPPRAFLIMDPASGQPGLGQPRPAGFVGPEQEFEITGIQPAEYFLRAQVFTGWIVKSIQWRGRDYTTTPFDAAAVDDLSGVVVTVTNATPVVSGTARGSAGTPPDSGLVVVFPAQPALRTNAGLWSSRMTATSLLSNGTYRVINLPAGDYMIAAIDRSRMATWRDPEVLAAIERQATRITLAWGQSLTQDLTMVVVR